MEQMSYRFEWNFDDEDENKPFFSDEGSTVLSSVLKKKDMEMSAKLSTWHWINPEKQKRYNEIKRGVVDFINSSCSYEKLVEAVDIDGVPTDASKFPMDFLELQLCFKENFFLSIDGENVKKFTDTIDMADFFEMISVDNGKTAVMWSVADVISNVEVPYQNLSKEEREELKKKTLELYNGRQKAFADFIDEIKKGEN